MDYQKPDFIEIKMDAELGAYQNELDRPRNARVPEAATGAPPPDQAAEKAED